MSLLCKTSFENKKRSKDTSDVARQQKQNSNDKIQNGIKSCSTHKKKTMKCTKKTWQSSDNWTWNEHSKFQRTLIAHENPRVMSTISVWLCVWTWQCKALWKWWLKIWFSSALDYGEFCFCRENTLSFFPTRPSLVLKIGELRWWPLLCPWHEACLNEVVHVAIRWWAFSMLLIS